MSRLLRPLTLLGLLVQICSAQEQPAETAQEPAASTEKESLENLTKRVRRSSVVITHENRQGGRGGTGSGFVVSEDGLIATCAHVIGEGRPLTVRFDDDTEHKVISVHAWDAKLDLAVLRIDAKGLEPLSLAKADSLIQGTDVIAMGAPQGLEFSVVRGVVSALREIDERALIQIAIPIEPGNSGGPLLDRDGRVHGLLTMKSAITENLGFAVPVSALERLLEKPNPVPMSNWLTIGKLDPKRWTPVMGAQWKQRAGRISVSAPGDGFGGRSLCLSQRPVPELPYEIAVEVLLEDEAGAAGLVFASDGGDRHYGFYPSGGRLRLTRFDGPDVFSWNILMQEPSDAYQPGEWNHLRARVEEKKITCWVNGTKIVELEDNKLRKGKAGLAKFRQTVATYRRFQIGKDLARKETGPKILQELEKQIEQLTQKPRDSKALEALTKQPELARSLLQRQAEALRLQAAALEEQAHLIHRQSTIQAIARAIKEEKPGGLFQAALLIARLDNPEIELAPYLEELDRMAGEVQSLLPEKANIHQKVEALRTYLFTNNGYHGSRSEYYNRSNSYLNEVIDDREGIPITLSLLFMELSRRLDASVHGLGLPGHFVACYEHEKKRIIIDPFEGAIAMPEEEANLLISAAGFAGRALEMPVATPDQIISRMLRNLKTIAIDEKDFSGALNYVNALLALAPEDAQERLSRALLLVQSKKGEEAKPDLEWLLKEKPEGLHLDRIRDLLDQL